MTIRKANDGGQPVNVTLDGALVDAVFEADDVHGWVRVYKRNGEGRFYEDPQSPGHVATETRRGSVRFVPWLDPSPKPAPAGILADASGGRHG